MSLNTDTSIKIFATEVVKALRKLGDKTHWKFDLKTLVLFPKPEDGDTSAPSWRINLSNHHREWEILEDDQRSVFLARYAEKILAPKIFQDLTPALTEIKSQLILSIRSEADRDSALTMFDDNTDTLIFETLVDGLESCVMVDSEKDMRRLTTSDLKNYQITETEAFEIAKKNLLNRSHKAMANLGNGLFISDWNDDYDSARILLPDLLQSYIKDGKVVAFAPTRNKLLVTSDKSPTGMAAMMRIVESHVGKPRSLPPRMLILEDGKWRQFRPIAYANLLSHLQTDFAAEEYGMQKSKIEEKLARHKQDIFVASYQVASVPRDQPALSACTWSKDVPSLLPRTDIVCLIDPNQPSEAVVVTLRDAVAVVGELISRTDHPLIRLFVDKFPNEAQLTELRKRAYKR